MDPRIVPLCTMPDAEEIANVHLEELRISCAALEDRLHDIADSLPEHQRCTLEAYMDARDELEFQTVRFALKWGKKHYK